MTRKNDYPPNPPAHARFVCPNNCRHEILLPLWVAGVTHVCPVAKGRSVKMIEPTATRKKAA